MTPRYVLAPEAAQDLVEIWRFARDQGNLQIADRVEAAILERIEFLARNPRAGHWRKDLTNHEVKFFPVYSYLIVYRPEATPVQVISILHGRRDVEKLLKDRM
jgi:antitoxin ParD1/3/4/toxin ParE1/3/4